MTRFLDGRTDGVTALLDLLSPLATQVKTGCRLRIKKTLSKVRDRYFWCKMSTYTKYWYVTCDMCESRKSPYSRIKAPLQKYDWCSF